MHDLLVEDLLSQQLTKLFWVEKTEPLWVAKQLSKNILQ